MKFKKKMSEEASLSGNDARRFRAQVLCIYATSRVTRTIAWYPRGNLAELDAAGYGTIHDPSDVAINATGITAWCATLDVVWNVVKADNIRFGVQK